VTAAASYEPRSYRLTEYGVRGEGPDAGSSVLRSCAPHLDRFGSPSPLVIALPFYG
jgi:hypothetical protein